MPAQFYSLLNSGIWHMQESRFASLREFAASDLATQVISSQLTNVSSDFLDSYFGPEQKAETSGGVAIVPLKGGLARGVSPVMRRVFGIRDTDMFREDVEQAAQDEKVKEVLIIADSPGGSVDGIAEAAHAVASTGKIKPITVAVDGMLASAAYHIGAGASRILAGPSSIVGSIGTFLTLMDYSQAHQKAGVAPVIIKNKEGKYKAAGAFGTALSAEQKEQLQELVQGLHDQFSGFVRAHRPFASPSAMQGQALVAGEAKRRGLIDAIATSSEALAIIRERL
jgi:capsid assembly protease